MTITRRRDIDGEAGEASTLVGPDVDEHEKDVIKQHKDVLHQKDEVVGYLGVGETSTLVGLDVNEYEEDVIEQYKDVVHQKNEVVGYLGGPDDISLLVNYVNHVASRGDVWDGDADLVGVSLLFLNVWNSYFSLADVTMEPCPVLHCSPESVEERGRSSNIETSEASFAGVHREITTILNGESAFLYGNVATENPKNPSSLSPSVSGYDWASRDVPLYWTQDPLKFTSWLEDKMTIDELDALNVLTTLPHLFSSRKIINCLEPDDFDSRVFDIMGRKVSARDWFRIMTESKSGNVRDVQRATEGVSREKANSSMQTDRVASPEVTVVEDRLFVRKRKGGCFIKPIHGQFGNGNHGEVAPASENIALTNIVTKPGAESAPDEDGGERHVRFGEAVEIEKQS
ncbi:hypothetical protein LR48_Vigan11g149400 [Vigna angularis]|uniref:Uncharacterized protein n=1 Tax=Phaseolus angularis TaxID=3914 RepID=A0A0L9VTS4_PHAAN|nr:hypothetical protein LR48_Vigan11g149400 [Vigna angularis]